MSDLTAWNIIKTQQDLDYLVELICWPDAEIREVYCHEAIATEEPEGTMRSGHSSLTVRVLVDDCGKLFELVFDGAERIDMPLATSAELHGTVDALGRVHYTFTTNGAELICGRLRYRDVEHKRGLYYRTTGLLPPEDVELPAVVLAADSACIMVERTQGRVLLTVESEEGASRAWLDSTSCHQIISALAAASCNSTQ